MKATSIIAIASILTSVVAKNIAPGIHGFSFGVKRGDDYETAHASKKPTVHLYKRAIDGVIETTLKNQQSFYSVELSIGDHAENVTVLMDTGSSDLWITGSNNPYCSSDTSSASGSSSSGSGRKWRKLDDFDTSNTPTLGHRRPTININNSNNKDSNNFQSTEPFGTATQTTLETQTQVGSSQATIDCSEYGTFDVGSSSTFHSNDTEFYIVYGDTSYAYGTWGYDDVTVGGTTVKDLSFAVANQTNSTVGVLGIGLEGLETTYSGALVSSGGSYTYANFPAKLVEDGLIHKRAYSLYLDTADADSGTILFGGVDHAKYNGTLFTVPLINSLVSQGYNDIIKLEITLSGIGTEGVGKYDPYTISTTKYPALLDSGTTLTYMPDFMITAIANQIGAKYSSSTGYYLTDCYGSNSGYLVYDFQGNLIRVPLKNIVLSTSETSTCVLGLFSSGDNSLILGDSFLRSAYVVYDLDDLQVSLAQAKYTDEEDIEVISSSIPSASSAAYYSITWSTYQTGSASGNIFTNLGLNTGDISSSGSTKTGSSSASTSTSSGSSGTDKSSGGSKLMVSIYVSIMSFVVGSGLICL